MLELSKPPDHFLSESCFILCQGLTKNVRLRKSLLQVDPSKSVMSKSCRAFLHYASIFFQILLIEVNWVLVGICSELEVNLSRYMIIFPVGNDSDVIETKFKRHTYSLICPTCTQGSLASISLSIQSLTFSRFSFQLIDQSYFKMVAGVVA